MTKSKPSRTLSRTKLAARPTRVSFGRKLGAWQMIGTASAVAGIVILGFVIFNSQAATTSVVGGSTSCGARVTNYSYTRPFGPNAAWNVPACALPKWSRSDDWVNRLASHAMADANLGYKIPKPGENPVKMTKLDFGTEFGLIDKESQNNDYSAPLYDARQATQQVRIRLKRSYAGYNANIGGDWLDGPNYDWNATVPWNPAWRPASGNDAGLVILDPPTGREWYLWAVARADMPSPWNNTSECTFDINNLVRGYDANSDLCLAAAHISKKANNQTADYRTYEGNDPSASGGGIQNYAGLITPEEVSAGEIRHATKFVISNTMFGPECPRTMGINDPAFGSTCGSALAPGGQFERVGDVSSPTTITTGNTPDERRRASVPEGIRFALNLTDSDINSWLNSRGYSGRKRETARIFAVAMRDYGLMVTDSGGGGASIQTSGGLNPETAKKWRDLGIDNNGKDFLFGLFTKDKLYVPEPPTNLCADGTRTQFYCFANGSVYNGLSTVLPLTTSLSPKPTSSPASPTVSTTSTPTPSPPLLVTTIVTPKPTQPPTATTSAPSSSPVTCNPASKNGCSTQSFTPSSLPTQPGLVNGSLQPTLFPQPAYHLNIQWKASTATSGIKEYVIARNNVVIGRSKTTSFTDTSLSANTLFIYDIRAVDSAGTQSLPAIYAAAPKCAWIFCSL